MLSLSLSGSDDERRGPRDDGALSADANLPTLRQWLEMLWPDTPSRWHTKTSSDHTAVETLNATGRVRGSRKP